MLNCGCDIRDFKVRFCFSPPSFKLVLIMEIFNMFLWQYFFYSLILVPCCGHGNIKMDVFAHPSETLILIVINEN